MTTRDHLNHSFDFTADGSRALCTAPPAISTRSPDFELTLHTEGARSGLSTGLIHGANGIAEHAAFIELTAPIGQLDIGAIYPISKHLDFCHTRWTA